MSQKIAICPNCGAQIQFRWSSAVQTVCEFCRSILVRRDVNLAKVGMVADLPPDSSPVQLGSEGVYRNKPFLVVGRILYEWEQGGWNEWHIVFHDGTSGWLSDAQDEYAVSFLAPPPTPLPTSTQVSLGQNFEWSGTRYEVTVLTRAHYRGVEGELPFEYWDKQEVLFADLRSSNLRFGTIDYSETSPLLFLGESLTFDDLRLKNLRQLQPQKVEEPHGLNCPNCGAALTIRASEQTLAVVCPQCLSILDARDPNLQVLQQFQGRTHEHLDIPLGSRGKFRGNEYEVIGFQVRTTMVEGVAYSWREYLLFNPLQGFRYLTEYNGHWNDVKTLQSVPEPARTGRRPTVKLLGKNFVHFQTCTAQTTYVLGEFPWQVRVGEEAAVMDFISPPQILSSERTEQETVWSLGEYITGKRVWEVFGLPGKPRRPIGIYSNQPRPSFGLASVWTACLFLLMTTLVVGLAFSTFERGDDVLDRYYSFAPPSLGRNAFVTEPFELKGHTGNVEIAVRTNPPANAYFSFALINMATGHGYDFGRDVTDGRDRAIVPTVPSGQYYLRVEPEMETYRRGVNYELRIRRDVPYSGYYWLAAVLILIPPGFRTFQAGTFEQKRWQESDYAK